MKLPDSLPQRMYLLALNPDKGRPGFGLHVGQLVRAAALTDLYLAGQLKDENGKAAVGVRTPCHDPVLDGVLEEIAAGRAHKWPHWVGRRTGQTQKAVVAQLVDDGWLRAETRKALGIFPVTRHTLRDPRVRTRLLATVSAVLRDPVGRADPAEAALVSLAVNGGLSAVVSRAKRKENKQKIAALTDLAGPAAPALKKAIDAANAAAAAA